MIAELRKQFNAGFTPEKYQDLLQRMNRECEIQVPFRICETPCFFRESLLLKMATYGHELVSQLMSNANYREASAATVPPDYRVPDESEHPLFMQADFGLVRDEAGEVHPMLVEMQGFPSLYGYQSVLARQYVEAYGLDRELGIYFSDLDTESYKKLLYRAIVGDRNPENVVLMELDPQTQKTFADFVVTQKMCGMKIVNVRDVIKQGSRLFYLEEGRLVPIERIYNRCVVDELVKKGVKLPFDFRDALDLEWAGNPNWYFKISKFSLPFLRHPSLPVTWFLSDIHQLPDDRSNFLLKPLYSFAGAGIIFAPSDEQIAAIPAPERSQYILQEFVNFTPLIETPSGDTQAEVRIMYIWLDELLPVMPLVRMGRGKMMGVDSNRDLLWVGASAGLSVAGM